MEKRGDRTPVIDCAFITIIKNMTTKRTLGKVYITYLIGRSRFRKIRGRLTNSDPYPPVLCQLKGMLRE